MLPATAYVVRRLGPEGYGQWAMAMALTVLTTFLTNLGLRGTFIRAVAADPASAPAAYAEQLGVRLLLMAASGVAAVVLAYGLGYSRVVLWCTALAAVGQALGTVSSTTGDLLQALQRLPTVAGVTALGSIVLQVVSVMVVWWNPTPLAVAVGYLAGPMTSVGLLLWIVQRQHFPIRLTWNFRRSVKLLWVARFICIQQFSGSASQNAVGLIVPWLLGAIPFGYFSAGFLLADRLTTVPDGVGTAAYPALANAHGRGAWSVLRVVGWSAGLVVVMCVSIAVVGSLLAGPIAHLLFPKQPGVCQQVIRITMWMLPLMGLQSIVGHALNALNKDAAHARASLVGVVCHVLATAILVWWFGVVGACWSVVLRYVIYLMVLVPTAVRTFLPLLREVGAAREEAVLVPVAVTSSRPNE